MERIAGALSDMLVAREVVESENREFYRYAIESILLLLVNLATMVGLAMASGKLCEGLFFLMVFSPLRSCCGGIHMKTWYSCYFVSCGIFEIVLLLSGMVSISWWLLLILIPVCELIIWKLAPCVDEKHPISEECIQKNRLHARVYSILLCCLTVVLKLLGYEVGVMLGGSAMVLCGGLMVAKRIPVNLW